LAWCAFSCGMLAVSLRLFFVGERFAVLIVVMVIVNRE
jgi:hypothetical protein